MYEKILMVEDEPGAALTVGDRLRNEGYYVDIAIDGLSGEEKARSEAYDLILLDLILPFKDGISICRDLRAAGINTPIIIVSARGEIPDKVLGLKFGADDYLTKPFDPLELLARIAAVLRRRDDRAVPVEGNLTFGPYTLDIKKKELYQGKEIINLSNREYQLLLHLLNHRGVILSRNDLLDSVWGYDAVPSTRTVDVHIAWLRQKLDDTGRKPRFIQTVTKRGYKFIG